MKTQKTKFGQLSDQDIDLYSIQNGSGVEVKISNYGATITSLKVPDKNGLLEEITCGFDSLAGYFSENYIKNAPYFGSTVGRYCSQIKNSTFILNGNSYPLAKNCGENNLHGGKIGFDKKIWQGKWLSTDEGTGVSMSMQSRHLEEGFPGNVDVEVFFLLNNDNDLMISYQAVPDQDTPIALTNHTYFNLSAFKSSVESHTAQIHAGEKMELDSSGAATGKIINLDGAIDDLRSAMVIGDVHQKMSDGFEHYYLFDNNFSLEKVADFCCRDSGRTLKVFTTEPGMLFYTGKYTSDALQRENGQQFGKFRAFCCETHRFPNGPNLEGSPGSITKAGQKFSSTTIFRFGQD